MKIKHPAVLLAAVSTPINGALEIIGSGYGRTGTDTTREALTELGYKTYHMREIIDGGLSQDIADWTKLAETACENEELLKDIFERGGWTAAVDFPASMCWVQLMRIFPNAKVIHTERVSSDKWWESATHSILAIGAKFPMSILNRIIPFWIAHHEMADAMWSFIAEKAVSDRDPGWPSVYKKEFIAGYNRNNEQVRSLVPSERLLIQDHSKGWKLLTEFLEKEIPDKPYPHSNTRADFQAFFRTLSIGMTVAGALLIGLVFYLVKQMVRTFRAKQKTQ